MKKETRVYFVDTDDVPEESALNIKAMSDPDFIYLSEDYGEVCTLAKFEGLFNEGNFRAYGGLIRILNVEICDE